MNRENILSTPKELFIRKIVYILFSLALGILTVILLTSGEQIKGTFAGLLFLICGIEVELLVTQEELNKLTTRLNQLYEDDLK